EIDEDDLPLLPETGLICELFGLDPLGLIASGSLLIAAAAGAVGAVVQALTAGGIAATRIGRVVAPGDEVTMIRAGERRPLPLFERDELARLLEARA
ncbi:MAG: hydrogenase expression protein, partial [Ardenticatenales bacterium]|nr:hydrogenase expression protein [Ardenticatenales bacterium]